MPRPNNAMASQDGGANLLTQMFELTTSGRDIAAEKEAGLARRTARLFGNRPRPAGIQGDDDLDYGRMIAREMAARGMAMPEAQGYYYDRPQYEDVLQRFYGTTPEQQAASLAQRQTFLNNYRAAMQQGMQPRPVPGVFAQGRTMGAPILPQELQRLPESTFAGRDYDRAQGPEYEPGFLNRLRAMLGY